MAPRTTKPSVTEKAKVVQSPVWELIGQVIRRVLQEVLENLLQEELAQKLGAQKYERKGSRRGYRNGYYQRGLTTLFGYIPDLAVPRPQEGGMEFEVIERYQRRTFEVNAAIGTLFLQGISTRKLKKISQELFGKELSAATVASTTAYLEEELKTYQSQPLADDIQFLFLDGISQKVREIGVEGKVVLSALGIDPAGQKKLLSFRLVDGEDTDNWQAFLADLKARGLLGKKLLLITTDGNKGLLKALRQVYPFLRVQRCLAHKMRNVVLKISRKNRAACIREAKLIFAAENKKEALSRFKAWQKKWVVEEERAVKCMQENLFDCLHFYAFPQEWWKKIRTTNLIERAFREIRRRTRPMGPFCSADSANKIMLGVTQQLNQNWKDHPLQGLTEIPQNC